MESSRGTNQKLPGQEYATTCGWQPMSTAITLPILSVIKGVAHLCPSLIATVDEAGRLANWRMIHDPLWQCMTNVVSTDKVYSLSRKIFHCLVNDLLATPRLSEPPTIPHSVATLHSRVHYRQRSSRSFQWWVVVSPCTDTAGFSTISWRRVHGGLLLDQCQISRMESRSPVPKNVDC